MNIRPRKIRRQIWDEFVLTITILALAGALLLIALAVGG